MSFKDKLSTIKKRKQPSKKMPEISEDLSDSANFPSLDDISDMPDAVTNEAEQEANALLRKAKGNKAKKGLFAKSSKTATKKTNKMPASSNAKQLKRNISLLSLLLVGLLGLLAYLFLQKDTPATPPTPVAAKPNEATLPADLSVNAESPEADIEVNAADSPDVNGSDANSTDAEMTENVGTAATNSEQTANTADDNSSDDSSMAAMADTTNKLPEVIDREVPDNQVQAAEELDLLKDERQRLSEQELLLKEQISAQEKLTELKAKRIEMLQKKIAAQEDTVN